jgi:ElaB/YqjD/DUF883 family membrane-anchored ribosome-binding protein
MIPTSAKETIMAEEIATGGQRGTSTDRAAKTKMDEPAFSAGSLGEQAMSAGRDLKDKAKDLAETSTDALKDHASDFVDAAKDIASQAADKLQGAVNDRKSSGADYVGSLAEAMRRASREFETELPIAATYIRKAASQMEGISDNVRTGNLNDVVRNAQSFARRQPTAFLGIAVLAGFGIVRFLKSSSDGESHAGTLANARSPAKDTLDKRG